MKKLEIVDLLKVEWRTVTFTKKDGSTRVMICTRNSDLIPEQTVEPDAIVSPKNQTEPEGVVRVYEQGVGWRSFKVDNVISIV